MNVITRNDIIYSNAFGDKAKAWIQKQKDMKASGQPTFFDKAKGLYQNLQAAKGQQNPLQVQNVQTATPGISQQAYIPPVNVQSNQGMSTGMKIGLAVGGVVVLGLIIFLAVRKK